MGYFSPPEMRLLEALVRDLRAGKIGSMGVLTYGLGSALAPVFKGDCEGARRLAQDVIEQSGVAWCE